MARYIDTGSGSPDDSLGGWLESNLVPGAGAFLAQTAWFSFGALEPFADGIADAVARERRVTVVLGANSGALPEVDLRQLNDLIGSSPQSALVVVRYGNATFHPKVFFIERGDGSMTAVVGSANLTPHGMEWNVEAGVVLDTGEGDDVGVLESVRAAIERWRESAGPGVFPVCSDADIDKLIAGGIIDQPQPPRPIGVRQPAGESTGPDGAAAVGYRSRGWQPTANTAPAPETTLS